MGFATIKKLWWLMTPAERRGACFLLFFMIVGMLLETLSVGLIVPAVALLTEPSNAQSLQLLRRLGGGLVEGDERAVVIRAMLVIIAAYSFKALFLGFLVWAQARFAFALQAEISRRLFAVYLHQPYTFHLQRNSAQLISNLTTDVSLFTQNAINPGLLLLAETLVVFGLCVLLLVVEPLGALIVVSVFGVAAWLFHGLTRSRLAHWGVARQHHEGLRVQHLQQGLGGVKEVSVLGREAEFIRQYHIHNLNSAHASRLYLTLQQLPRLWLELLAVAGLGTLVVVMVARSRGLEAVLPTIGLFAAAAFRLMPSVNRIITSVQSMRYGLPVIDTLFAELQLVPVSVAHERPPVPFAHALRLDAVTFTYPGAYAHALDELTLEIQRGECVGIVGASGAGKSTLIDVLLGLLAPTSGKVRIDGKDIWDDVRGWQRQIGYVPQTIFLTDDTLRRNVAFGLPDEQIDDAAVWRSIRAAQLDRLVATLPLGLDTMLGERGVRLSGGERQRIGIARALYHDPSVLVLDEATSSLDNDTERGVMEAVSALHGTKTIIIVAHRLSTVEGCNRIYQLESGRVVEESTPRTVVFQHPAR
jgi:ABC-type multidrug transport system fused ATPase/permease subunit